MPSAERVAGPVGGIRVGDDACLLGDVRDFADIVLIDTPPLLTSSDVIALGP